jgi:glycosyltransferase involved in cell wall biosynthesis
MKVLLSALACSPGVGSEPGTGWHWSQALSEHGHDVTVLTMANYRDAITAAGPRHADFRFIDVPTSPVPRLAKQLWTADIYHRWQQAAFKHVAESSQRFDVVHHVTWGSLHLGSELWRLGVPLIYGPIGGGQTAPGHYWRYFGAEWPVEVLRTAATGSLLALNRRSRQAIHNSAMVLVDNSDTAAACHRLGAREVRHMMSYGLPQEWIVGPRARQDGIPTILWAGRLIARKAPVLAVEAFAELRKTMPARLVIAGDGPLLGQVRATAERRGVAGDVEMLGHVSWAQVLPLYDSADVLLFTSLRESFGAPILEAFGRGLPVVALDLHGIGDADVGPAALKVPLSARPSDLPGQLGAALHSVLYGDDWEERSKAAIEWVSQWAWPAKAVTMTKLYEEVASVRC